MTNLKALVLQNFKKIHRTRLRVFDGDEKALLAARLKINDEFRKNQNVRDEEAIKAMLKFGDDVERELRTQVIQAREVKPGVFEAKISQETLKMENTPYNDSAIPEGGIKRKGKGCCQNQKPNDTKTT
ncbi:hypothetical protein JYU34_006962 [Plutella xylostella]|uniref:Complex III assembly factor LYRM7 n=2 Tax=Plutella xylostella TaxID=51655 RepID=A0A8S4FZ28_PLUXY|nr:complex III assembly factor LYRM7 [Plutella xylostella]KAG7308274.1 hypothetical protein JYU34_006962 [Plutella xylostella]CAG9134113.1 unnamed protein product [Plutella xylostella]